jgi:hypothetical protein
MFKDLLNTARSNFATHQREEEIKHLDIDPEEYVMLRDDKSPMAAELLKAILEKLKIPNWEVDEGTLRIVRISEAPGLRKNWSLAMTSDTRRFHLKVYRDFEGELDEVDLASSRGICAAIAFVEQTIHDIRLRKIREAEIRKLAAIEAEKQRKQEELENILTKVDQINERCRSLYSKELNAAKLGEELLASATEYINHKVDLMPKALVSLPVSDINSIKSQFGESQFKIIDRVPCQFDEQKSLLHVSNLFIKKCIEGKNFISPVCSVVGYDEATRSLIISKASSQGGDVQPFKQHHGLSEGRLDHLTDPLNKAAELLVMAKDIEAKMNGEIAKISVLSIYSEVSSFKDLMTSIDTALADIAENVKLIIWNISNSKQGDSA